VRKLIGLIAFLLIVSLPAAAQTQQPIRVNCGGPSYTDSLGHVWAADYGYTYAITSSLLRFLGTAPLTNGQAQCVLYTNPSAMGISTQFTVNLNLTDSAGHQLWQLSLGMNPAQVNLGAIQNSSLNVVVQKL
jgi:hypothetical protein